MKVNDDDEVIMKVSSPKLQSFASISKFFDVLFQWNDFGSTWDIFYCLKNNLKNLNDNRLREVAKFLLLPTDTDIHYHKMMRQDIYIYILLIQIFWLDLSNTRMIGDFHITFSEYMTNFTIQWIHQLYLMKPLLVKHVMYS